MWASALHSSTGRYSDTLLSTQSIGRPFFSLDHHRRNLPDLFAIFPDRSIRGKVTDASDVEDRLARPCVRFFINLTRLRLAVKIGAVVGQEHVFIVVQQ